MRSVLILILSAFQVALADELICAGGNEVFIVDAAQAETGVIEKRWRWSGEDAPDLPDEARKEFLHLDECKPVDKGARLLLCASNGGCALIDRATKRILWRAHVRNAHSMEMLPRDRVVVASSLSGDHLEVFDLKSSTALVKAPLQSAHGVVWDEKRQRLWALGFDELRSYKLKNWDSGTPALELEAAHKLPDNDGHDLRSVPASNDLILTTEHGIHHFDRGKNVFQLHPTLGSEINVKSADIHPATGRIVLSDWKRIVHLFGPDGRITFKDASPYKVRWMP